jgi:cytochrome c553
MQSSFSARVLMGMALVFGAASARAQGATPPVPDAIKDKIELCSACHGPAGISTTQGTPSLAGQPELFVQWQLVYFRGGTRQNEQMNPVAEQLSDDDVRDLSAYFVNLPGPSPSGPDSDPALTKTGGEIAADRHCSQCHLPNFVGQGEIPRLAGQREEVTVKALHDYQHGARRGRGNVIMPEIAYSLNEDDIKALAHFMSRQPGT